MVSLRTLIWGKAPDSPAENKLLRKIDFFVLSYVCLSYCINYLDRANLANAYVSGMKEDVGLVGNTYTYAGSCFTAGYVIGNAMWGFVVSSGRIPPRIMFPGCMLLWGVLTLATGFIHNYQSLYAIRLFSGIFEASTFSGTHYILGSWYKEAELGKRTAIFTASAQLGSLFSGVLCGAIIDTLDGKTGLKGWQWLFVIDFIITFPVCVYGFLCFPDTPQTTKAWWMTEEEQALCVERLHTYKEPHKMTWSSLKITFKKAIKGYRYVMFCLLFTISATCFESFGVYTQWAFYMKYYKGPGYRSWTLPQINYYPTILTAVAIVMTFVMTLISDSLRSRSWNRLFLNYVMYICVLVPAGMALGMYHLSYGAMFFGYSLSAVGYTGQASNFAWANGESPLQLIRDDETLRALTLFSMNMFSNIWALWYGIVAFPVSTAPQYKHGQIATMVTGFVSCGIATTIWWLNKRYPQPAFEDIQMENSIGDAKEDLDKENALVSSTPVALGL